MPKGVAPGANHGLFGVRVRVSAVVFGFCKLGEHAPFEGVGYLGLLGNWISIDGGFVVRVFGDWGDEKPRLFRVGVLHWDATAGANVEEGGGFVIISISVEG